MNNPLSDVLALGRVPAAVVGDIRAIAEAALRVSVIERTLMALLSEQQLVGGEITRVRSILGPQEKKVSSAEIRDRLPRLSFGLSTFRVVCDDSGG